MVNDQDNTMLSNAQQWWEGPNANSVDSYFFGHGNDYMGALYEYTLLGGAIAMTPRSAMGVSWSRWFNMNDRDVNEIVNDYENRGLPLDNFILDSLVPIIKC
jgi:alpha-glucosidase (family GH31 glycosyl hydrolase)